MSLWFLWSRLLRIVRRCIVARVRSVRYYDCGRCFNQLAFVFRGHRWEHREFPSGVFLVEHEERGLLLFDTGYSDVLYRTGVKGWLYRRLNPTRVEPREEIAAQLRADGVDPGDVAYVALSHLHPDHIGGIRFFPQAEFVVSEGTYGVYRDSRFKDLFFERMVPSWFGERVRPLTGGQLSESEVAGFVGHDFFGDGSVLFTALPGHTRGHMGLLVNGEVLLAGDACWGQDLMCCAGRMRKVGQMIQHDYATYVESVRMLEEARERGIRLCFAHDSYQNRRIF